MPQNLRGDFFDSHCIYVRRGCDLLMLCTVESLQHNDHPGDAGACRSFCGRPPGGVALPYASTTIVGAGAGGGTRGGGLATISTPAPGGCIPNPQAYMIQPQPNPAAASSDNFPRSDVTAMPADRRNDFQGTSLTTQLGYCYEDLSVAGHI